MKIDRKNNTIMVSELGDHSRRDAKKLYHQLRVKLRTHPTLAGTENYVSIDEKTIIIQCDGKVAAIMGKRIFGKILRQLEKKNK
jgi:hypothetical protein